MKNWHLYEFKDNKSYHQSRQLGPQEQFGENTLFNNANFETSFHQTDEDAGADYLSQNNANVFGIGTQVNDSLLNWKFDVPTNLGTNFPGYFSNGSVVASVGTSAGNPLIFKGGTLVFKAKIKCSTYNIVGNGAALVAKALENCLTYNNLNDRTFLNASLAPHGFSLDGFDPSSETANADFEALRKIFDNAPSYSFDLNIQDGEIIGQPYAGTIPEPEDYRSKLICSVKRNAAVGEIDTVPFDEKVPVGHFIVIRLRFGFNVVNHLPLLRRP